MTDENALIEIKEYDKGYVELSSLEFNYLDSFNNKVREQCKSSLDIEPSADGKYRIANSSFAGVMQVGEKRLLFGTKVNARLMFMLSFLRENKAIHIDPTVRVDFKDGELFFDPIGRLFVNELETIIGTGLLRSYQNKEENLQFLKGRLILREQLLNQARGNAHLFCNYDDLTFDNLENRIILCALTVLQKLIKFDEQLRFDLIPLEYYLKDIVTLVPTAPEMCDRVRFNRLNEKYHEIIAISKIILQRYFIESEERGQARGFNFLVNMNKLFEDFITSLVQQVVTDRFKSLGMSAQQHFKTLDTGGKLTVKPDIGIYQRTGSTVNEYKLIIDAKYKKSDSQGDYYQMIAYSLAVPTVKQCILVYPEHLAKTADYEVYRDVDKQDMGRLIRFSVRTIDLYLENEKTYSEYIKTVKDQIGEIIEKSCLKPLKLFN